MTTGINRRQFGRGALAASTALTTAGRALPAAAAPVKIRVGWVVVPASSAPLVLAKKDILKHFGQSYVAEAIHFEGTPPVITAMAAPPARTEWAFGSHDQYRDPNGMPNLAALQSNLQLQKEVGLLRQDIDVKKFADLSMVAEAAKRLG